LHESINASVDVTNGTYNSASREAMGG
jgi:hypothetical protein